jgi:hypothetical protein
MFIRVAFITCLLGIVGYASAASANSCSNVTIHGSYDQPIVQDYQAAIRATGTFRIEGEADESKQPLFNLAIIRCLPNNENENESLECNVTQAVVWPDSGKPDPDNPNCSLDLTFSTYTMKELQKGILTGIEAETAACINTILTIDRNTKRVYLSFTRTKDADKYDKIRPGTCGSLPRTQILMNCTSWAGFRLFKRGQTHPSRYCNFSSSNDK